MSYADMAKHLKCSPAQITQARGLEPTVSEKFWNQLAAYVGYKQGWQLCTSLENYQIVSGCCEYSQENSRAQCISFEPGMGKSATLKAYASQNANVFYVECEEHFRNKDFVRAIVKALAIRKDGRSNDLLDGTRTQLIEAIVKHLVRLERPLLIIDEFDKLNDSDMQLFKTFYNKLEDVCGFIVCGAPFLRKRVLHGKDRNRQGFKEIFSRIGGDFVSLKPIREQDIRAICEVNGLADKAKVDALVAKYIKKEVKAGKEVITDIKYCDMRLLKEEIMKRLAG